MKSLFFVLGLMVLMNSFTIVASGADSKNVIFEKPLNTPINDDLTMSLLLQNAFDSCDKDALQKMVSIPTALGATIDEMTIQTDRENSLARTLFVSFSKKNFLGITTYASGGPITNCVKR